MVVYLVRHGEATGELEDPKKPLSSRGRQDVQDVAKHISSIAHPSAIFHSTKLRARQSAEIMAAHLEKPSSGLHVSDRLSPGDDPDNWADRIEAETGDIMLVGHLPYMARLASTLLTGSENLAAIDFQTASVLCLQRASGRWWVRWLLSPDTINL